MNQIEQYHYQDYQFLGLPVFAWGGAAFAYFGQDWGAGTLTSYEIGDGSHSALFQSMTAAQVQQNVDALTYDGMLKIGTAVADADALFNSAPGVLPQDALAALQGSIANNEPSLTDLTSGVELALKAIALVYGTTQLTQAQESQAATKAFVSSVDDFFRSGMQDASGFLNAVGSFLGVNIGNTSVTADDLPAIEANFSDDLPYLHVVQAGDTYDTIAASLGMSGVDGQVLADLNRGQEGDFLTPGSVVLLPVSVSTLGSQAVTLSGTGSQDNVIDLESGLLAEMPLLGSGAGSGITTVLNSTGGDLADIGAGDATTATLSGGVLTIGTSLGGTSGSLDFNTSDDSGQYGVGGNTQTSFGAGSVVQLTQGELGVGTNYGADNLLSDYELDPSGALLGGTSTPTIVSSDNGGSSLAQQASDASGLLSAANTDVGLDEPSGPPVNTLITNIEVADLGTLPEGQLPFETDPTGSVADGLLISGADVQVTDPTVNDNGLFSNSPAGILSGYWRPGNQDLSDPSQNLNDLPCLPSAMP